METEGSRASPQQNRLRSLQALTTGTPFRIVGRLAVQGELDAGSVQAALSDLVAKHDILSGAGGASLAFATEDLSQWRPEARQERIEQLTRAARIQPIAIEGGPLLSVTCLHLDAQDHRLLLVVPALCADEIGF